MRAVVVVAALLAVGAACSTPDPPNPDAAVTTATTPLPDDDATLDALEEQHEDEGVKDIRADAARAVTIRLDDGLTVADAATACAAVRAAGFPDVRVDVDGAVAPCP